MRFRSPYHAAFRWGLFAQPLTPVVRVLLITNACAFLLRILVHTRAPGAFDAIFGLNAQVFELGFYWQFFTYMFLHAHVLHLLFNMLILYFLGTEVENTVGSRRFLWIYFVSGLLGGLGWFSLTDVGVCIGASGAVLGLLGAYAALFPNREITLLVFFVLPITLRAWMLAALMAFMEFTLMTMHVTDRIAHSAHLSGLLAGYVFVKIIFRRGGIRIRFSRSPSNPAGLKVLRREDASSEVTMTEVDRVLDKIANEGLGSLTSQERKLLERASSKRR